MPRMIVAIDGVVIKEVQLTKERTTLGRRPYNDIVIDNLAVSGEHAVLHMTGQQVEIEDLGSTNGTYVNTQPIKRQELRNGDTVEVGKYKIRFLQDADAHNYEKTMAYRPSSVAPLAGIAGAAGAAGTPSQPAPLGSAAAPHAPAPQPVAVIRVLSGPAAGREVTLQKVVTTIGKPGVAVASITKRHQGFVLAHVEGTNMPLLNGVPIGPVPVTLKNGDRVELAGTEMGFEEG